MQALFYLPALISSIYITVTVALHKVDITYPTCSDGAMDGMLDYGLHHNFIGGRDSTGRDKKGLKGDG